ncbi:Do family serine endopeptidase [Methyloceanibacter sp.]|uniref:Do family serine endopeptidase n=1 Tax=Methyloceanibacter sp. TaxID=1965321 RepID=UPI002C7ADF48|nr:Do family serine endopeptidase [Methyloceanibacter sp.]HML92046.1 Do family serine endopeptidase [Methyloceanibacter sp.]
MTRLEVLLRTGGKFGLAALIVLLGAPGAASAQDEVVTKVVPKSAAAVKQSFAPVVKRAAPTVVNVYVRHKVQQAVSPLFNDPFFRRFFGQQFGVPRERIQNSLGSGVLVNSEGVVVTNYHVIRSGGESEITVALNDGREFPASLILKDEQTDLAVLRLESDGAKFPAIEFANSDSLEVGDLVLAIGDPFGVGQTVTSGIVSALARTKVGISDYQFFIQTDAAINPGNSGGALVDLDGHLVGINTAIFSKSGGSHGIGFAIPSNMVQVIVQSALKGGKVQRPWLGASLQPLTSDLAESLGLARPAGAMVTRVHEKGPATRAGLKVGDVIVSIDGKDVQDPEALQYRFVTKGVGGTAELGLYRDGKRFTTTIATEVPIEEPPRNERDLTGANPFAGSRVANLSPAVSAELGMNDDSDKGVVVLEVESRSNAGRLGLRPGDIIVGVNDQKIESVKQLSVVLQIRTALWKLAIERGGKVFDLTIRG